jgi:hypothetical protein
MPWGEMWPGRGWFRPAGPFQSMPATMMFKMWSQALSRENFFPGYQSRGFARFFSRAGHSLDASDTPFTVDRIVLQQYLYPGAKQAVHPLLCFYQISYRRFFLQ